MKKSLKNIFNDKESGSEEILGKLNLYVLENMGSPKKIKKLIDSERDQLSSFQAVQSYLNIIERFLIEKKQGELLSFIKNFGKKRQKTFEKIYANFIIHIKNPDSILTISNSKTVFEILKMLHKENPSLKIYISESRPGKEGRILAKKLLKARSNVFFLTEAQSAHIIEKVDFVLIGADKILSNGNVINKVGSKNLAIISKYFNKPFIVITSKDKFTGAEEFKVKEKNPYEIWKHKNKYLKILNFYFEEIEKELITKIVTN